MTFKLQTLKKRADFLRARNGRYFATPGLILQASKAVAGSSADVEIAPDQFSTNKPARFGFTATKKLGNAVVRNRTKRRLREAVRAIAPQKARSDYEYVLIGRKSTLKRPFSSLLHDLTIAFAKVHGKRVGGKNRDNRKPSGARKTGRSRSDKQKPDRP